MSHGVYLIPDLGYHSNVAGFGRLLRLPRLFARTGKNRPAFGGPTPFKGGFTVGIYVGNIYPLKNSPLAVTN